jgi:alanyl-tRNA synthetase
MRSDLNERTDGKGCSGRSDMAQAGIPDGARINDALAAIESARDESSVVRQPSTNPPVIDRGVP